MELVLFDFCFDFNSVIDLEPKASASEPTVIAQQGRTVANLRN